MSRTKSTFWGIVSSQGFMMTSMLLNIIITPYIVKGLNSQLYGLSVIIFQITSYLGQFDFGLGAGISRYLAGFRNDSDESKNNVQKVISTSLVVYIIIGFSVAIGGVLSAPLLTKIFNIPQSHINEIRPIISIVCILVGMQFVLRSITGIFFAHQRQALSNTMSFIVTICNTLFVLLFIYNGFELWSFVYAQLVVFVVNAILNIYFFRKHYKNLVISVKYFDKKLLSQMFSFGFFIFLNGIAVQLVFQTDRVLVGSIISLTAVTVYSLTTRIPELVTTLIWKITENAFPGMVELSKNNETEAFKDVHDTIMKLTMSLSTICFWIILLASFPFLKLWVGEEYFAGNQFVILVTFLYLIQHSFIHVTAICLNGAGFVKGFSIMSLFEAAFNLALSIWLCKTFGLIGAVLGTIIAGCITSVWYIPYVAIKHMKFNFFQYVLTILKPVSFCSIFGLASYLVLNKAFHAINNWLLLIASVGGLTLFLLIPFILINKRIIVKMKAKILSA